MIAIDVSVEVDCAPDRAFDFVANFENNPRWQKGMQSAVFTSAGPLAQGSTYDQVARFLGKEIRTSFVVCTFEAGSRVGIESTSGPFPIRVTREVRQLGDARCLISAHVAGDPRGFFRVAKPLLTLMVRRSVKRDYRRLKRLLEQA